ncbi:MAG: hypothetical protein Q9190_001400 [Brigantiaea leucoxantha]
MDPYNSLYLRVRPTESIRAKKVAARASAHKDLNEVTPQNNPTTSGYFDDPFIFRQGRRYLRDSTVTYPLPVDVTELHRQNLSTMALMEVYGSPFCSPLLRRSPPKKVLEMACGSAFWSSACYDYLKQRGYTDVSFTGLDIVKLAPDLAQLGMNWRFVQHDLRCLPLPFQDQEFDFIFVKDTVLCAKQIDLKINPLSELKKYLKPGGVIEVWESDLLIRCLLPCSFPLESEAGKEQSTATYDIGPETSFAKAQNRFLHEYDVWAEKALDRQGFTATPCALMGLAFSSEPDSFDEIGSRRVAIPFGEIRWEREQPFTVLSDQQKIDFQKSETSEPLTLTPYQVALRRGALEAVLGLIEGLEPMLMMESGKKQDEWDHWWAGLNTDLLERNGTLNGECLETGAWWARKRN